MDDKVLEQALAQMLKPLKNIPFSVIMQSLAERAVIPVNKEDAADIELLGKLKYAIQICAAELKSSPIKRPRPNEVGNDIEAYIMRALLKAGLNALRPTSQAGVGKSSGYPDIILHDRHDRATYLECKTFAQASADSTFRSFFLSPSVEAFKVSQNARHLLLAFGMKSRDSVYTPESYKLIDLHNLLCDVKFEFNSSNRRLYGASTMLLQGAV